MVVKAVATAAEATATAENKLPEKGGTIMKYTYTARKVTLRDNFKERAEKKLDKFGKLFSENATVNIVVTLEKNRQTVEVTIRDNGLVLRADIDNAIIYNKLINDTSSLLRTKNLPKRYIKGKLMKKIKVVTYPNPSENINTDNAYSIPHIKRTQKVLSINLYPL